MNMNKKELRKLMHDFNVKANAVCHSNIDEYIRVLSIFVSFVNDSDLISGYIKSCGKYDVDMANEFDEVSSSYGECFFNLGYSEQEEVSHSFAILSYLVENPSYLRSIINSYSEGSKYYKDMLKNFNNRVTGSLIRNIENYLSKIGIDMGLDENKSYIISCNNGQVNIADNNSSIVSECKINSNEIDNIKSLLEKVKEEGKDLSEDDKSLLEASASTIMDELESQKPNKGKLNMALSALKGLKETAAFIVTLDAAIPAIMSLISKIFPC